MTDTEFLKPQTYFRQKISKQVEESVVRAYQLACKLRDEAYDESKEFDEDISTLCDQLHLIRIQLIEGK